MPMTDPTATLVSVSRTVNGRKFGVTAYVANDDGPYIVREYNRETETGHQFGIQLVGGSTGKILAADYYVKPKPVDELLNIIMRDMPSYLNPDTARARAEHIARDIRRRFTLEERENEHYTEDDEL